MDHFTPSPASPTRLIISAILFFSFSVVTIPPHDLVYSLLWLYWDHFFLLRINIPVVFPLVVLAVNVRVTVPLFMAPLFTYITLLILRPILHRNLPIIHRGCLLFSILFRLVYSLLITFHHHKLRHHLMFPYANIYYQIIKYNAPLDLQVNTSLINPHHSISEPQLLSSNIFQWLIWHTI